MCEINEYLHRTFINVSFVAHVSKIMSITFGIDKFDKSITNRNRFEIDLTRTKMFRLKVCIRINQKLFLNDGFVLNFNIIHYALQQLCRVNVYEYSNQCYKVIVCLYYNTSSISIYNIYMYALN